MQKLTILDGGMGRELKRIGAPFSQPLWSAQALIEAPHFVANAHKNFIEAGAQIITVNSYACVPFHLGQSLYEQQGKALAKKAAIIARKASDQSSKSVLVAGSIPPVLGSYRPDLFVKEQTYKTSIALLHAQQPYVDLWIAETISSIQELKTIIEVFSCTEKPCFISLTLADTKTNEAYLRSNETVIDAVKNLLNSNIQGVFFNCSVPEVMEQAILDANSILKDSNRPFSIGVYANNFVPIQSEHEANSTIHSMRSITPDQYLKFAKTWYTLGATVIGGCCGIEPRHIAALSKWRVDIEQS